MSAIARHTGRDRKTVKYLEGEAARRGAGAELCLSRTGTIWSRGSLMIRTCAGGAVPRGRGSSGSIGPT